jgi:flagellar motor switch protein FliM
MGDVLDQSEVNALLAAMDTVSAAGEVRPADPSAPPAHFQPYDFRQAPPISSQRLKQLQSLHENFCRAIEAELSTSLRTPVEASVLGIEQITYGQFILSLPHPTCMHLLQIEQSDTRSATGSSFSTGLLKLPLATTFTILDRLLGGPGSDASLPQRLLTQLEQRLILKVIEPIAAHLTSAWSLQVPTSFSAGLFEPDPRRAHVMPANEAVVALRFELKIASHCGTLLICLPCNVVETLCRFSQPTKAAHTHTEPSPQIRSNLSAAKVHLAATLRASLTLNELMNLEIGDCITTSTAQDAPIDIEIEGRRKFTARLGLFRGHKSAQITSCEDLP